MPSSLVTGGAGFLGSHLCDRLIEDGHEVICLDSFLTGAESNVDHLVDHPSFTFRNANATEPIPIDGQLDYVWHFASPASPKDYLNHPIETLRAGAMGTEQALRLAQAKGARFLLASTSEVYGDPEVNPQPETYWGRVNPIGPRSVYDEAKRYAEALTMAYHRHHGRDVRIARIFNTYGPRMKLADGRVLPNFITQALRGEPLTVYGDGTQTRSFCYVSDLIQGVTRLMRSGELGPINLGNPDEMTIHQVANEVIEATGSSSEIRFEPIGEDDPKVRRPDIARAQETLQWKPTVARKDGLVETVAYFRHLLDEPSGS
ncbi:MAG: UDP-glucuronic acid decarboxylase family protein [Salinibacter sp.]